MAVLSKEEIMTKIKSRTSGTTDEDISFVEDVTDTFNDLYGRTESSVNWESKYKELDESWRKRYTDRFFDGGSDVEVKEVLEVPVSETVVEEEKEKTFDDIFDWDDEREGEL